MPRITALSMLNEAGGKEYLAELYGKVIENMQKGLISASIKNRDLSGDPTSGSVEAKRFANAVSKDYGTARTAGKGDAVKAKPVTVVIDKDKEIVEELAEKDIRLFGVDGVLDRRASNHELVMQAELDTAFFAEAGANSVSINLSAYSNIEDYLEAIIQELETTKNSFVDGVPRSMMRLVLAPELYGKVRNNLDKCERSNIDTSVEEFYSWHGVETKSCVHLPAGVKCLLMIDGAVAQPVYSTGYKAEKIPLSENYAVELFYYYGTKAVTPDLIFKPGVFTKVGQSEIFDSSKVYYTLADGVYSVAEGLSSFATGTTYYTMA